jgi:hypothetical protein
MRAVFIWSNGKREERSVDSARHHQQVREVPPLDLQLDLSRPPPDVEHFTFELQRGTGARGELVYKQV